MQTDTNIVSLLTQSFTQSQGVQSGHLTDSTGRPGFDQVLGREVDRSDSVRGFTPRESSHNHKTDDPFVARDKGHNPRTETPVRSDRPKPPEAPIDRVDNRPTPIEDGPAVRSDQPIGKGPENPQAGTETPISAAPESLEVSANPVPATENSEKLTVDQQALREQLENLNIDPEIINTLLENLAGNPEANKLLQSLLGQLNTIGVQAQTAAFANAVETKVALHQNQALQTLVQAGLSQAQAHKLIQQSSAAVTTRLAHIESAHVQAPPPQVDGLKGNGAELSAEKLSPKQTAQQLSFSQSNAEAGTDSDAKSSSNGNGDRFERLASLLQTNSNANPAAQATSPFKLALNPLANLNGTTATTALNVSSAESLAIQTGTAIDSAGKTAEAFKPLLAQTYSQRGGVEKTLANQIIERISFRAAGAQKEINIKLDPPSLGSVRINVSTSGETVRTTIVTENSFVKQVVENSLPQLRDSLANQGIKVDHFSVLVGGDAEQNTAHQQESARPKTFMGPDHEAPRNTGEETFLTQGPVIFNESTINVFA